MSSLCRGPGEKKGIYEEPSRYIGVGGAKELFSEMYAQMGKFGYRIFPSRSNTVNSRNRNCGRLFLATPSSFGFFGKTIERIWMILARRLAFPERSRRWSATIPRRNIKRRSAVFGNGGLVPGGHERQLRHDAEFRHAGNALCIRKLRTTLRSANEVDQ